MINLIATALALASSAFPAVHFDHLPPGWHQYVDQPGATALNWNYRPNSLGWASSMPGGGIAVNVWSTHAVPSGPARPLRLVLPRKPSTLLEGTRDTPEYRISGRLDGADVNIFVDIRRLHPTASDRRLAQRILRRIRFS